MRAPPPMPEGAGRMSEHLRFIYAELQRLQPIFGPGQTGAMTTRGVVRNSPSGTAASAASDIQILTSVREGYDAVECVDENSNTVYCLKPPGFRTDGRIDGVFSRKGYVWGPLETASGYLNGFHTYDETHYLWEYGGSPATRVGRIVKTANADTYGDDTALGRGVTAFSIFPYYTEIVSGGTVDGQPVIAMTGDAVRLDSDELTIDSGGDVDASFTDVGARAWVPVGLLSGGIPCQEYESRAVGGVFIQWPILGYA